MRKFMILAAPLALVACAEEAVEEVPVEDEVGETEAAAMTTANGTAPGTYTVTTADGTSGIAVLNDDGTSQDMDADGNVLNESTWAVVDGQTCFTSTGEDGETVECWTESEPAEDGSFTATSDEGEVVTVSPQG